MTVLACDLGSVESGRGGHDLTRYQGRNLAYLVLAICVPAALLYVRLVLGLMATSSRITREQAIWFSALSNISLVLFFLTQLAGARYLQRMLKPRSTRAGNAMQYVAVFLTGILFSLTGAIMLEAFGFAVLLRTGGPQ